MEQDKIIKKNTVIYTVIAPILHSYKCSIEETETQYIVTLHTYKPFTFNKKEVGYLVIVQSMAQTLMFFVGGEQVIISQELCVITKTKIGYDYIGELRKSDKL